MKGRRTWPCGPYGWRRFDPGSFRVGGGGGVRRINVFGCPSTSMLTFAEYRQAYIKSHEAGWRNRKHRQQWQNTLDTYAFPIFGSLPVDKIDTGLVMQAIEPIWTTKTETASRLRGRIEAVLGWAKTRGHRSGENPARWRRPESTPFAQFTRMVLAKTRLNLTSKTQNMFRLCPARSGGAFLCDGRRYIVTPCWLGLSGSAPA